MILHDKIVCGGGVCRVTAQVASFATHGGVREWHAVLHVDGGERQFADQAASLRRAFETLREGFAGAECLMCRLFLSDAAAQQRAAAAIFADVPLSMIQQPPLDGSKVAVWAIFCEGVERVGEGAFSHNGYTHRYALMRETAGTDSASPTTALLEAYGADLCIVRHDAGRQLRAYVVLRA
ncbi:MAG: hypothetical protein L6V80_07025 [Bacteroidales bacterium]|nr:MAG: hypothetical protein L6V80_07025 [Bacteroidales bacterium]